MGYYEMIFKRTQAQIRFTNLCNKLCGTKFIEFQHITPEAKEKFFTIRPQLYETLLRNIWRYTEI